MAKIYGINGKITGKVGNTVFAVDGGIQVARQYNPIVANPRTEGQQTQRLKVDFAGQMSKGIVAAALEGLGGNRRQRRSALLSNLIKDVVGIEQTGDGKQMQFKAASLRLSGGTKSLDFDVSFVLGSSAVMGKNQVQVALTPAEGSTNLPAGEHLRIVVVGAPTNPGVNFTGVVSAVADVVTTASATQSVNIDIDGARDGDSYSYAVYAIPLSLSNESLLSSSYVQGIIANSYFVLPVGMVTGGAYDFGRTYFLGMKKS